MPVDITVYSQSHCQPCVAVKRRFDAAQVTYKEVRADLNQAVAEELRDQGFRQSPVVTVWHADGTVQSFSGFDPDRVDEAIEAWQRDRR